MAEWHALAKLRIHTDGTLMVLEDLTRELGKLLRQFRDLTCSQFSTVELPRETAARVRNNLKHTLPFEHIQAVTSVAGAGGACKFNSLGLMVMLMWVPSASAKTARKPKTLNLFTVKFHFLGDYVRHI